MNKSDEYFRDLDRQSGAELDRVAQWKSSLADVPKLYYCVTFKDRGVGKLIVDPVEFDSLADDFGEVVTSEKVYYTDADYEALREFES